MSDDVSEASAAIELAFEAADELSGKDPKHELLKYTEIDRPEVWEEFQERFGRKNALRKQRSAALAQAHRWVQYYLALKKALEESSSPAPIS